MYENRIHFNNQSRDHVYKNYLFNLFWFKVIFLKYLIYLFCKHLVNVRKIKCIH